MINCDLLVKKAYEGRANAYTPYSNFKVGAAVLTEDDTIYTGCNIENASYGIYCKNYGRNLTRCFH